jgi:recombination protein RecR
MSIPKEIKSLSSELSRLPGVGPKLSLRLSMHLALVDRELAKRLSSDISTMLQSIRECSVCSNIANTEICDICLSEDRDRSKIIVVENSIDLNALEQTGQITALFHVLKGVISPINGIGPEDIEIKTLIERAKDTLVEEVVFALNPNLEGDATSLYIKSELLSSKPELIVSRIGKGVPVGSSIEYMSNLTLLDSLNNRDKI